MDNKACFSHLWRTIRDVRSSTAIGFESDTREFLLRLVCGLGYRHFSTRTPNRFLSAGAKMWILGLRPPVRCNAPDSFAGQALRTGGALLIGAGLERSARGIVASEQTALIADAKSSVRELMDGHRAAHEMDALAG